MYLAPGGIEIPDEALDISAIRAQGAGGQNVNKVASAIHLRCDLRRLPLPDAARERLLAFKDRRIGTDGVIVIKAQRYRTQERNRADALQRLAALLDKALTVTPPRRPTKPPPAARRRRLEGKRQQAERKRRRRTPAFEEN